MFLCFYLQINIFNIYGTYEANYEAAQMFGIRGSWFLFTVPAEETRRDIARYHEIFRQTSCGTTRGL